jgi:conserved oligomeric Golgi complex subunit 3
VESEVNNMLQNWMTVEEGGVNLKDACERLLQERVMMITIRMNTTPMHFHQNKLVTPTNTIGSKLEYSQESEHATRMLNHPGETLNLLDMVERVDICIDFLKSHVR